MSKGKVYIFNGTPMTLSEVCQLVTCYGREGVRKHLDAGRCTTTAITTYDNAARRSQPHRTGRVGFKFYKKGAACGLA